MELNFVPVNIFRETPEVTFLDARYTFDTNNLTVGRNSSNIVNAAADLTVATEGAGFTLVFSGDATVGWTFKDK